MKFGDYMLEQITYILSFSFIQRAIIVGLLISLCSALLGVTLVLKQFSMIGDGLSHIGFGALAVAVLFNTSPLVFSVPIVTLSAIALLKFNNKSKIKGDSAIAIISTSSLAVGVFIVSKTGGNTDISSYLFGSILSISKSDAILCVILSAIIILAFILLYHKIFAVTFDESFAKATGVRVNILNTLIAVLTALTIVIGMRLMGTLLISSLIIFSPLSAMRISKTFNGVVILSALISIFNFIVGFTYSYFTSSPTGASIVIVSLITMLISVLIEKIKSYK